MKKKIISLFLIAFSAFTVASCGKQDNSAAVKAAIEDAQTLSYDDLLVKAKAEVGDKEVQVFGNSSALEKALVNFTKATGIKIANNKLNDGPLYEKLENTIGKKQYSADMVLIQDGNSLQTKMLNTGYLVDYTPKDYKDVLAADDLHPTAAVYLNKVFMYNNTGVEGEETKAGVLKNYLTNVWQLAGTDADKGHIKNVSFKLATQENINMNFLVMLTSDEWVTKLKAAYKDFYGKDYVEETQYKNIGYKWIAEFLKNTKAHKSDGTACKDTAKGTSGTIAYCNFNKLKDCKEEGVGKEDKANLTTAALEGEGVKGFGGFVYKMYTMVARNAKYPYAACALVNYILSTEGFKGAWGTNLGYYSTNPNAAIAEGDKALSWWKQNCVIENPAYVASVYSDVYDYVSQFEA